MNPIPPILPPMLRLQGVGKSFGTVTVMKDVTFDVAPGEFVVFVGPSRLRQIDAPAHDLRP